MAYCRIAEILETLESFHSEVLKEIRRHSSCNDDTRLQLLSDYLQHQQQAISEAVQRDEEEYPEVDVREVWIQFIPKDELKRTLSDLQLQNNEPLGALFTHVLEADQVLLELYDTIIAQTNSAHVREFFESLRKESISFAEQRSWGLREPSN